MTSSRSGEPLGSQQPRIWSAPDGVGSGGAEAVELAALAGLDLDPWQQFVLEHSLGERPGEPRWASFEVGLVVSRQNGKGSILEARELAGLFLLGEKLIIHSAHQYDTSQEHFARLLSLIEMTPDFDRRVMRVDRAHGSEGIQLKGGQRIRFRTRTKSGGRGFSADLVVLDEAMILPVTAVGALMPTLSTRPNPQIWYTGSAVDQYVHPDGLVFARIRDRGIKGDPSLAFFEWSVDCDNPMDLDEATAADPAMWAQANPGQGIRITREFIENERRSMDPRTFAVERLGVGDWPAVGDDGLVISVDQWLSLVDAQSKPMDPVCFAFDVPPDRSSAAIAVAGKREDGLTHLEVVEHGRGTGWVASRLALLNDRHHPAAIVCHATGPVASLLAELRDLGVEVTTASSQEMAQACGMLYDGVEQRTVQHLGTHEIVSALKGATKRPLGDAWAWDRKSSAIDISPLVAVTLALWGTNSVQGFEPWATHW